MLFIGERFNQFLQWVAFGGGALAADGYLSMAALIAFYDANVLYSLHLSKRKARRNPSPHCRYFFNEQLRSSVRHLREPVRTMALVAAERTLS